MTHTRTVARGKAHRVAGPDAMMRDEPGRETAGIGMNLREAQSLDPVDQANALCIRAAAIGKESGQIRWRMDEGRVKCTPRLDRPDMQRTFRPGDGRDARNRRLRQRDAPCTLFSALVLLSSCTMQRKSSGEKDLTLALLVAAAAQPIQFTGLGLDPVALDLGFFAIKWYSLAYLAGILIGYWYLTVLIRQPGAPMARRHADDFIFYATLGIILGGRLGYILFLPACDLPDAARYLRSSGKAACRCMAARSASSSPSGG